MSNANGISLSDLKALSEKILSDAKKINEISDQERTCSMILKDFLDGASGYYADEGENKTKNRYSILSGWWLDSEKGKITHEQELGIEEALKLLVPFILELRADELLELQNLVNSHPYLKDFKE